MRHDWVLHIFRLIFWLLKCPIGTLFEITQEEYVQLWNTSRRIFRKPKTNFKFLVHEVGCSTLRENQELEAFRVHKNLIGRDLNLRLGRELCVDRDE